MSDLTAAARRPAPALRLARPVLALLLAGVVALYSFAFVRSLQLPQSYCPLDPCAESEAIAVLDDLGLPPRFYLGSQIFLRDFLVPLGFVAVGALIFWRKPDDLLGLCVGTLLVIYGTLENTAIVENGLSGLWLSQVLIILEIPVALTFGFSLAFIIYTFPDGRFLPRWAWVPMWLTALAVAANSVALIRAEVAAVLMLAVGGFGLGLQVYRFRRLPSALEKKQVQWALAGLAGFVVNGILWFGLIAPAAAQGAQIIRLYAPFVLVNTILTLAFPVCLGISILRYRLWDIDLIIRRTLIYSVLTAALGLVYLSSVVILQTAVRSFTGSAAQSQLAIVASTLAIAALFSPLRRRVQDFIDRRFFRRKYDAARALSDFAATARDETDLDRLAGRLVTVVQETMQPEHAALWLRPGPAKPASPSNSGFSGAPPELK